MLSFHVKFVQTDRWTDGLTDQQMDRWTTVKQHALDLSMRGHNHPYKDTISRMKMSIGFNVDFKIKFSKFNLELTKLTVIAPSIPQSRNALCKSALEGKIHCYR